MNKHMWKSYFIPALAGAVLLGCGGQLRPETEIAAVATEFQKSEKDFISARKRIAQDRQRTLNGLEEDAAQTRQQADMVVSLWRVTGDKDKLRLFEEVITASRAASERAEALTALREEHARAQAQADTKVALDQDKLAKAIKLLGNLGAGLSQEQWAKFVLSFAQQTQAELNKAAEETDKSAQDAAGSTKP